MFDPKTSCLLTRRRLIQFGAVGYLGLNLGGLWRAQAARPPSPNPPPIESCILIFLYGGPSHLDTFDPKPNAAMEIRGEFRAIETAAPGIRICEHLPRMARLMDRVALIRSMHHSAKLHDSGSIQMLTGRPLEGPDRELFAPLPQQFPSFGSAVAAFRTGEAREVPFASLPYVFQNVVPVPCQGAGFLGGAYEPLRIDVDPARREYQVEAFRATGGPDRVRMDARRGLLAEIQHGQVASALGPHYEKAIRLLDSRAIREALEIDREPPRVRERYGFGAEAAAKGEVNGGGGEMGFARGLRAQNFLMARRLVEAGVPFVNVYDYKQQGQNWDAHAHCGRQHRDHLLPQFDQGLSALIEDLEDRGLLESTLIVATGEFGRTPRINANGGRDHWPDCSSVLLAGGGVSGGAVYGASDSIGAYPSRDPVTPGDLAATIYWRFGIDPATEIRDQAGRPYPLATGRPLRSLFGG